MYTTEMLSKLFAPEPIGVLSLTLLLLAFQRNDWSKDSVSPPNQASQESQDINYGLFSMCTSAITDQKDGWMSCMEYKDSGSVDAIKQLFGSNEDMFKVVQKSAFFSYIALALALVLSSMGVKMSKWLYVLAALSSVFVSSMWYLKFKSPVPEDKLHINSDVGTGYYLEVAGMLLSVVSAFLAYRG